MFRGIAAPRVFKMFLRFLFSFLQEKRKQYHHQGQLVYEWDQSLDEVFFFFGFFTKSTLRAARNK
jgi:hypothetical protein